jgi:hypothetical protein
MKFAMPIKFLAKIIKKRKWCGRTILISQKKKECFIQKIARSGQRNKLPLLLFASRKFEFIITSYNSVYAATISSAYYAGGKPYTYERYE